MSGGCPTRGSRLAFLSVCISVCITPTLYTFFSGVQNQSQGFLLIFLRTFNAHKKKLGLTQAQRRSKETPLYMPKRAPIGARFNYTKKLRSNYIISEERKIMCLTIKKSDLSDRAQKYAEQSAFFIDKGEVFQLLKGVSLAEVGLIIKECIDIRETNGVSAVSIPDEYYSGNNYAHIPTETYLKVSSLYHEGKITEKEKYVLIMREAGIL